MRPAGSGWAGRRGRIGGTPVKYGDPIIFKRTWRRLLLLMPTGELPKQCLSMASVYSSANLQSESQ